MSLFTEQINNWDDWGKIFQSIPAFTPLIEHIMTKEKLLFSKIENLKPGANAVFKVGGYVVKIFMPLGVGREFGTNVDTELFGMRLANLQGVPSPKLIADGVVEDKYTFRYMIMEYIHGKTLGDIETDLSYEDKINIGKQIRAITDKMNVPCENFTDIDVMEHALNDIEWENERFPASFQAERLKILADFRIDEKDKVYCHGDFHCENVLVDDNLNVYLIDFADAMYAPTGYEEMYVVSALFCFEKPYMVGYYDGDYAVEDIVDLCMTWYPVHVWGHATASEHLKPVDEVVSFAVLRERLHKLIEMEKNK